MLTDLAVTPFAEPLRLASAQRLSGELQVRSGRTVRTVYFDRGHLVFAASNRKQDRLGESLVSMGRISSGEFEHASMLMKRTDRHRRFGDALVQAGVMDKKEVGHSVATQVRRIVISLFELTDGVTSFDSRACSIPFEYMVSLSVHRLLYQGIKRMKSAAVIRAALGDLNRKLTLASVSPFRFSIQKCSSEELEILERCRRPARLRDLVRIEGGLSGKLLRTAYALLASGVLVEPAAAAEDVPQPIVQMETGTFLLSTLQREPEPSPIDAIRAEVKQELERSAELSQERWLRVTKAAPTEELVKAIEDKLERYRALTEVVGGDAGLQTDIELIMGRAYALLQQTRKAHAAQAPDAAGTPSPRSPEPAAASGDTPGQAEPAEPKAASRGAKPEPPPSEGALQGDAQLTLLLMEAEARMTVSDYGNAVRTYTKIVELQPGVAEHHVRLGVAMALWPRSARRAERVFHQAVRLEPNNAEIHFRFGLYYKAMKLRRRALQQMRTTLSLNPRHKLARRELQTLSPKDTALTQIKKLFK